MVSCHISGSNPVQMVYTNPMLGRPGRRMTSTTASDSVANPAMDDIWQDHHRYLLNVGYRMLGSLSEAEDVVQEAFIRLMKADIAGIVDIRGWLVVAVTRLCLDQLRSARARREVYVGPWLPEPVVTTTDGADPADIVVLDDSVRMAMMLVLERLSPAERIAFILHDVFQFSFADVADITGRSLEASRQLASRARKHVQSEVSPARFVTDADDLARVADRFIDAAGSGDLDALLAVLDPAVVGHTDSGGRVPASTRLTVGRERVATQFLRFMRGFGASLVAASVNGEPGALVLQDVALLGVIAFDIQHGAIVQIHAVANPDKLRIVAATLGLRLWADGVPAQADDVIAPGRPARRR